MNKRKLTATFNGQTFTRTTHKNYSHVVIVCGRTPSRLESELTQAVEFNREQVRMHGEQCQANLDQSIERKSRRMAENQTWIEGGQFRAINWTSRPDLAAKAAATAEKDGYFVVKVIQVDGPAETPAVKHLNQELLPSSSICGQAGELTSSPAIANCPECLAGDLLAAPVKPTPEPEPEFYTYERDGFSFFVAEVPGEPDARFIRLECGHNVRVHAASSSFDFPADGGYCQECKDGRAFVDMTAAAAAYATDSRVTDILSGRETWSQCKAIVTRKFAQDLNDADRDRLIKYVSDNVNMSRESQNDAAFKGDLDAARACELAGNAWQSIFTNLWEFSGGPVSYANRANGVAEPPAHVCDQYGEHCPGCEFEAANRIDAKLQACRIDSVADGLTKIMGTVDGLVNVIVDGITVPDAEYNRIQTIFDDLKTIQDFALNCRRRVRALKEIETLAK